MTQKQKSKLNPFAAYLRPTEDLLWQSSEQVTRVSSVLPKTNLFTVAVVGFFILLILIIIFVVGDATDSMSRPLPTIGVVGLIIWLVRYWLRFKARGTARGETLGLTYENHARYAISSERLFYERGHDLQAESLDNISVINVLPNNTLSFGAAFPQWTGLGDAEQVKLIIEQAQKERQKALSAGA